MKINDNDIVFSKLYAKYNKLMLSKKEVAEELNISSATLNRRIKNKEALPKYIKEGGKYFFPITELSRYLKALSNL